VEINSRSYWDWRFSSGDWEEKKGREQTASFARALRSRIDLPSSFSGTLLDFGCGLGDAIPVYRQAFPNATLVGVDRSTAAIARCRADYGRLASFFVGDHRSAPKVSVIVASNVLEHVAACDKVLGALLGRCQRLYVLAPYREPLQDGSEHVHSYDETSLREWQPYQVETFLCRGWSQSGPRDLWWNVHAKNLARLLLGRPLVHRARQILFCFLPGDPS
jgi:SAM-dependent methyltransferase